MALGIAISCFLHINIFLMLITKYRFYFYSLFSFISISFLIIFSCYLKFYSVLMWSCLYWLFKHIIYLSYILNIPIIYSGPFPLLQRARLALSLWKVPAGSHLSFYSSLKQLVLLAMKSQLPLTEDSAQITGYSIN